MGDHGFSAWVVHDNEAVYVAILAVDDVIRNDNALPESENLNTWDDDNRAVRRNFTGLF